MKILITGFDPFDKEKINPSYEVVKKLKNSYLGFDVVKLELPTVFFKSFDVLKKVIDEKKPNIIINLGQAGGRKAITPERVAINIMDSRIADNEDNKPEDEVIVNNGENAYFSTLPIKIIVDSLLNKSIKCMVSNSAGTYVCNYIMYKTIDYINKNDMNTISGFIHIPYIYEQVIDKPNIPYMKLDMIVRGIELLIEECIVFYNNKVI